MEGLTISEMAEILGIAPNTVMQRLYVAKIKPISKEAIYDKSALETIRNVPNRGRPPRVKPDKED
jgi:predicted DNA binding protein